MSGGAVEVVMAAVGSIAIFQQEIFAMSTTTRIAFLLA
jgi:hypothetical protein